ncbi:MAG: methionine--tRNA ligase [Thermoanaerobaculaceae bacterium]|nr:methionine--tRNA ligase [Thermoanaerobaculaceae bacterium]MDI9622005.1 methionine--tRNA ligase [Acidobacteriota bacterium]NLH12348.1 methionine--tRNA ligase [Holophagae bacterium]HPW54794.1 methionine--tRNA ligase [Thermoanaerobaculaceae bacterium]
MSTETYYITTPIYYVNDLPHIGHIYTTVVADTIARYKRLRGLDVRFLTGTDEHGQKIDRSAAAQQLTPRQLADRVVGRFHELWRQLDITHDDFIRTTEARHHAGVHAVIARMVAKGDIYRGDYEGWYCSGCEAFYPQSQLVNGKCPDQGHPVELTKEDSYFFRLSEYQQRLLDFYAQNPDFIRPTSRYNEVVRFVESGLRDLSISRASLTWGIPFPSDASHVVYVWLDALTNYISALGFGSGDERLYQRYWPASLHLVGKDILRFHCVYWPAFLMSAELPLPKQVFGHGWWLKDEAKMSKSLGNVVRPDHLLERFGSDPLRYFLLREMTFGLDASFSDEAFVARYNADLANGLGNAASRVLAMARRYFGGLTPPRSCGANRLRLKADEVVQRYVQAMDDLELQAAIEAVWDLLSALDGYVNDKAPWKRFKSEGASSEALQRIIYNCLETLRIVAVLVAPVMPRTASALYGQLGLEMAPFSAADLQWLGLPTAHRLGPEATLFPRVDVKEYFAEQLMTAPAPEPPGAASAPPEAPMPAELTKTGQLPPEVVAAAAAEAATSEEELISIDEFARTELKVGLITHAERVPKSKKLVRMEVDLGEGRRRQIVAGVGAAYTPEQLFGRRAVFVANLKPATLMGLQSEGMILAASIAGKPYLLGVDGEVPPGTGVK